MNIISFLITGFSRACKARNAVFIVWFEFFLLSVLFVYPLRAVMNNALGSSMITERLAEGPDIEVFSDLGDSGISILSFFTSGFFYSFLVAFILNAFLTGGLFGILRKDAAGFSAREFFRASGGNFLPFLLISFVLTIAAGFFLILLVVIPLGTGGITDGGFSGVIQVVSAILFLLMMPLFLLVADISRARKASCENVTVLQAIGFGLNLISSIPGVSYLLMVLLTLVQILLLSAVFIIIPAWMPETGEGVLLMLIVSQILLIVRLFLKVWRYASVTAMMESAEPELPEKPNTSAQVSSASYPTV